MEQGNPNAAARMQSSDFFYGWDLLYKTVEEDIAKKADVLMVLAHFLLTKHCKFRCVGIGDVKSPSDNETGSELLPDKWNEVNGKYALRYVHNNVIYLMLAHMVEDALIVNLIDWNTKNVSNLCITPDTLVNDLRGNINKTIPTASAVVERIRKELCDPVFTNNSREAATMQQQQPQHPQQINQTTSQTRDPLLADQPRRSPTTAYIPHNFEQPARSQSFPDVGRGDLDPLNAGGPGNLFPFPRTPNPQRPNVPGQSGPNPDHSQPPDWNPDQYMWKHMQSNDITKYYHIKPWKLKLKSSRPTIIKLFAFECIYIEDLGILSLMVCFVANYLK